NDAAPAAAVETIVAGADLIVTDDASGAVAAALREAVSTGQISPRRLADATRRVLALKVAAILPAPLPPPPDSVEHALRHESHTALARRLASRLAAASPTPAAVVAQAGPSPADLQSVTANGLASATPTRSLEALPPDSVGMSSQGLAAVDRIIEEAIEEEVFTAAALALGRRGGLVRLTGYGSSDENGDPLDPGAALFDLASLTKVVGTTSAVAALIESGEMELDAPVRRWIGEFSGGEKDRVTIRHLLTHTSGLPPWLGLYASAGSPTEALSQVIEQSLVRPPGEISEYSDLGMILLAAVVERAAGMPIDQLLAERLFIPLDMASTMFLPPLAFRERAIPTATETERPFTLRGVVHDGNAYRLGGVTGHAGLFSTAHDLAIFSQMMLNGGSYGSVRIFSEPTVRAFTTAYAADAERGLGWDKPADRSSAGRFLSAASFGHTGFTGTSIWIDPARDLFVVLLTNRTFPEASAGDILEVRMDVHEAAAQAITDYRITARPEARR
ncbi:MAG: serine hydrolase, partial [Gemmatimonadota bacterium]